MTVLLEHLDAKSPKKILSLDGGGIREALTLGIADLARANNKNCF